MKEFINKKFLSLILFLFFSFVIFNFVSAQDDSDIYLPYQYGQTPQTWQSFSQNSSNNGPDQAINNTLNSVNANSPSGANPSGLSPGPTVSSAYERFGDAGGLVPCDGIKTKCDFIAFVKMLNRIMSWLIGIATLVFTLTLIYGGFLYLTSGNKPANKDKAKSMMWSTLVGFVIILTAWLIVHTILVYLVPDGTERSKYIFKFIGN